MKALLGGLLKTHSVPACLRARYPNILLKATLRIGPLQDYIRVPFEMRVVGCCSNLVFRCWCSDVFTYMPTRS
jgi:hypothetical protein